jgi:hypothetical protein
MKSTIRGLRRASVAATFIVVACTALLAAQPASAATPASLSRSEACSYDVNTTEYHCYSSQTAALAAIAAGGPLLTEGQTATGLSPLASYVLAIFYQDANYGGAILDDYTNISTLCQSYSYTVNSMPAGWNDDISSYHSYGTCKTRVSENINQGGSSYGPVANAPSLGVMNDATSSFWITG